MRTQLWTLRRGSYAPELWLWWRWWSCWWWHGPDNGL